MHKDASLSRQDLKSPLARLLARKDATRRDVLRASAAAFAATMPWGGALSAHAQDAGGTLIIGGNFDITTLDPHTGHDLPISCGQLAVYDSLLRYQGNPAVLEPLLAKEVTGSPDAGTWTIKLVDNAIFHDGSTIDAQAVKYSFDRMLTLNRGVAWMFAPVMDLDSVRVVDDLTLEVTLTIPFAPFDAILPWLFVGNPALMEEHAQGDDMGEAWLVDHEAGSGPFVVKQWEPGSVYEFERFPDYWYTHPEAPVTFDRYIWRVIREPSSARIALEQGEIHLSGNFTSEDVAALAQLPNMTINEYPSFSPFSIKLNNQVGPTADINVRKALAYAFDYQAVIDALLGRAVLLEGPLPSDLVPWHKADLPIYRHDMEQAKAALAMSAEYANGGFSLEYVYIPGLSTEEQIGLIMLEAAAELNIEVKMTPLVWPDMVARAAKAETAPAMMAVYSGTPYIDPDNFLWQAYHSSNAGFWAAASHYVNPELDKLLEDARASNDQEKRKTLYDQAQLMLVEDAVEIWVMDEIANDAWVSNLQGISRQVLGIDPRQVYFG